MKVAGTVSIVIPAYNEEKRLPPTLKQLDEYVRQNRVPVREVLVVNDGSLDGTADLVRRQGKEYLRVLENPGNQGKGYSVRHGMLEAQGDWVLLTDADLSTPIEQVEKLLAAADAQGARIAIGSRALDRSLIGVHQPAFREYSGRVFNFVMRTMTGLPFSDTQCGFKLYEREAARAVFSRQLLRGFSFDVEHLFIARKLGIKTVEVPVVWNDVEGTKVSLMQGLRSFSDLLRIRRNEVKGLYK
jgi:dolichyl-phosphate beta-glucosyltransferase